MFKKKSKDLTTDEAPDSIAPWEMLDDADIALESARLSGRFPDLNLTVFARHQGTGDRAAFDKGPDGTGKAVVIVNNGEITRRYPGFGPWFDAALAERR